HQQTDSRQQNGQRADTVDGKTNDRLADSGYDVEDGHQRTELGITETKLLLDPWKQRRQHQLKKMRCAMGNAYQANDACIVAKHDARINGRHWGSLSVETTAT